MEQFIEFALKNWFLFLALIIILGLLIGGEVFRKVRGISTVNPTQALQLINNQNAVVIDIRDGGEYQAGHIPDARHIPRDALNNRLDELGKFKARPIIIYCRSGNRAFAACNLLKKHGFEKVHYLQGGLPTWQGANLPISKKT